MARPRSFDADTVVEDAMQVFWTRGYAATTPQHLVDSLGIGRGSLYNAFGNKHMLYERALRHYAESQSTRVIEVLERPGSAMERLRAALLLVTEAALAEDGRRGCMATNAAAELADRDATVTEIVRGIFARQEMAFDRAIKEGQRTGEIDAAVNPAGMATLLLAITNGVRVLAKTDPDRGRIHAAVDMALRALRPA